MSSLEKQDLMEQAIASNNQLEYIIFSESQADLRDLLEQACLDMATKLFEIGLITDQLYDSIAKRDLVITQHERTRAMLKTIYSKLKKPNARAIMKSFIAILRMDQAWYPLADEIEQAVKQAVKQAEEEFPEASVLRMHMSDLADSIGDSLVFFANHAESKNILTTAEKQIYTDPSSKHDQLYTQKLMDQVGLMIAMDKKKKVFDQFVKILSNIGGPLIAAAKDLRDALSQPPPVPKQKQPVSNPSNGSSQDVEILSDSDEQIDVN